MTPMGMSSQRKRSTSLTGIPSATAREKRKGVGYTAHPRTRSPLAIGGSLAPETPPREDPSPVPHPTDPQDLIARYLAGETMLALRRDAGVSRQRIQQILAAHGITHQQRLEAFDARVRALHDDGLFLWEMAKQLGCTPTRVNASLARQGLVRRMGRKRALPQGQIEALLSRYQDGEPIASLAEVFGVSLPTVRAYLDAAGADRRRYRTR